MLQLLDSILWYPTNALLALNFYFGKLPFRSREAYAQSRAMLDHCDKESPCEQTDA
jgi:hypothetical protein